MSHKTNSLINMIATVVCLVVLVFSYWPFAGIFAAAWVIGAQTMLNTIRWAQEEEGRNVV